MSAFNLAPMLEPRWNTKIVASKPGDKSDIIPIGRARKPKEDQASTLRGEGNEPAPASNVRAIAISGGKGGTGKSVIAANLAVAYAQRGSRTLALDADLGMADLNLLLGLAPGHSLLDVMEGMPIDDVLVEAHGIHVLPALNGSFPLANIDEATRHRLFAAVDSLDSRFDTLVIDTAPGIADNTVNFAAAASEIIVVITPESLSLADAYSCLKALHHRVGLTRAMVLPNKIRRPSDGDELFDRLASVVNRFLGISLTPLPPIPFDPQMAQSNEEGIPLLIYNPDAPASRAIRQVARRIEALARPEDRQGGVRLFLRRTFDQTEKEVGG
jgi:flagellar biosynthesis protein FlhG